MNYKEVRNKTKYFRLRLNDEVSKRAYRPEAHLNRALDK